jgi:transposase
MSDDVSWFVGVDWASAYHRACLLDGEGTRVAERDFPHDGTGLAALCDWLLAQSGAPAAAVAVAIETPRGPVVEALLERGFAVFSINPKQLDRFRDRFTMAGAKDDSRDAQVLASSLRTDRHALRRLRVDDPLVIELREWSRIHEELTQERSRLANRVRDQLWRYYPQARQLSEDLVADWFLDLWQQAPTPAQAARTSEKTIGRILKQHRIRRIDAGTVLRVLRQPALTVAPGTAEAATAHIRTLAARARLINAQLKEAQRRLDELCDAIEAAADATPGQICEQRDVVILRSLPGLGRITLATLLAEATEPVRCRDYHALRSLTGAAPVTRRSGKSRLVVRRHACNKRLAQAVFHWARVAMQHDPTSARRYEELRRRGHSHGRALRGVADRLLYVLCTLLERQVPFDADYQLRQMAKAA